MSRRASSLVAFLASVASSVASSSSAWALCSRDTAEIGSCGDYSIGVFAPLVYDINDNLAVRGHPLTFFVAPNAVLEVNHGGLGPVRLKGEYGLSVPTGVMMLLQGFVFPTWDHSDRQVGWFLVPRAGVVASLWRGEPHVLSGRVNLAVGVPLTHSDATPLGGIAPLELLFAPVLASYRAQIGVDYDRSLLPWLRARAGVDVFAFGDAPAITLRANLGVDIAVGEWSRFLVGCVWWNSDTGAIDLESHESARSNDFLPTVDFIWAG